MMVTLHFAAGTSRLPYSVNFRGRKLSWIRRSENFAEKTFTDCLKPIIGGCGTPPNFVEKTFADGSKSAKVFPLESFPLCGNLQRGKGNPKFLNIVNTLYGNIFYMSAPLMPC